MDGREGGRSVGGVEGELEGTAILLNCFIHVIIVVVVVVVVFVVVAVVVIVLDFLLMLFGHYYSMTSR